GQSLINDFLGAANRERCAFGELLHGRSISVNRGLVEVGAELFFRVLRVLGNIGLTAQADDCLLLGAVSIVFETLTVEVCQPHRVIGGPENVIHKEAVAIVGCLLCDFWGADGSVPHEGSNAIKRARGGGESLQWGAEASLPVNN